MRARRSTLSSAGRAVTAFIRPLFYRNLLCGCAGPPAAAVTGFDQSQALALQIARRDLLGTIAGIHLAFISLSPRVFERHTHAVAEHRLDRLALECIAPAVGDPAGHTVEVDGLLPPD